VRSRGATPGFSVFDPVEITVMQQDDENQYHNPAGYVYTDKMALELSAIWDGVDKLEHLGIAFDTIACALEFEWQATVTALAMLGGRHA
jgi:hypothetical protein